MGFQWFRKQTWAIGESSAPQSKSADRMPATLPFDRVSFEFVVLSRKGEAIAEDEFNHLLLTGPRASQLSRDARMLLKNDCLKLTCERRRFVQGRAHREPEIFRVCRQMANVGQINMGPSDHDFIAIGRGAFRLRYEGPIATGQAHLSLMVHAAETVRMLRPGIVIDREARQIWGEHSWQSQLERHKDLAPRDHFKIEMSQQRSGVRLTTRGLSKFGLPDLRMEKLPNDLSGIGAISITSIALDLVHAEHALDPQHKLAAPIVQGEFGFQYTAPKRGDDHSTGILGMLGAIEGETPTELGLLEVLSRLRRRYEDGETFGEARVDRAQVYQEAQQALSRLKDKFDEEDDGRVVLIRKRDEQNVLTDSWFVLRAIEGSTFKCSGIQHGTRAGKDASIAFDQAEVCDWVIMRGGDVEDGGFGMDRT